MGHAAAARLVGGRHQAGVLGELEQARAGGARAVPLRGGQLALRLGALGCRRALAARARQRRLHALQVRTAGPSTT